MSKYWPIHTLVFDLDDTLYLEREFVRSGFAVIDSWVNERFQRNGFFAAAWRCFEQGKRGRIFDEALAELEVPNARELVPEMIAVYRGHEPQIQLCPDARDILDWAAGRFHLAIITDGYAAVQRRKLQALGLEGRDIFSVVTDELGRDCWKPSPLGFRRVMERFGGEAFEFAYVADNPRKDFLAPKALGWRTIRIRRSSGEHCAYTASSEEEAEMTVGDLSSLRDLLGGQFPVS